MQCLHPCAHLAPFVFLTLVESLRLTCRRLSLVLSFLFMQDSFIGSADLSYESLSFTASSSVSYPLLNMI